MCHLAPMRFQYRDACCPIQIEMRFFTLAATFVAAIPCVIGAYTITVYSSPFCPTNSDLVTTYSGTASGASAECIPVPAGQSVDVATSEFCNAIAFFSNSDCTGTQDTDVDWDGDVGCQTFSDLPTINSFRVTC
jgi:hypothetical protein